MLSRRRDEVAHVLARDALGGDAVEERCRAVRGSRPFEHILIGARNLAAGPLRRDAEKVPVFRDRIHHAPRDLRRDILIDGIAGREGDIPLRLDFEDEVARRSHARDYQVIELEPLLRALEPNGDDPGVGQTRCPIASQQREQIQRAELTFDIGTGRPPRCRARTARDFGAGLLFHHSDDLPGVVLPIKWAQHFVLVHLNGRQVSGFVENR